ncbi:C45 family autoproteolytic acyltransferase/hydolase [Paeniglutamicibacter sp. NPDC091659]|uniref:C45 family autoproteolytic acyltransferase/hydolase n=1 Tax=Paeniglutamicibacter sp. NPDC091659 TaxID=3364389 RepID=UPI0037F725C2
MKTAAFPRIRVSGGPFERGEQYGSLARTQVHHARNGYERSFATKGFSWDQAVMQAQGHAEPIRRSFPDIWEEMRGIAKGSNLPFEDILAMNCRTEVLWQALVASHRKATGPGSPLRGFGECSSFAIAPTHTALGHTLVGQNWDWLVHGFDSVILLEVEREDGPNYVTIVEAGLLAKTVMNEHGIGMAVNTLVTSSDGSTPGVPFHVLLRALANCEHVFDAVELLASHPRASSGNYVVGAADGSILNIETAPGDARNINVQVAEHGKTFHTNHFLDSIDGGFDLAPLAMSDSYVRLSRLRELIGINAQAVTIGALDHALRDHTDAPGSICCHPDERSDPSAQWSTVMSVVMDLEKRVLHLAEGNPCQVPRKAVDYSDFLQPNFVKA